MIEELVIEQLGGSTPVEAEGRLAGRPFYFRARHDEWSFSLADDPDGDPIAADFGDETGWFRRGNWSCAAIPADPGSIAWQGDGQPAPFEACDHVHCAGYMPNVLARNLIVAAAEDFLAGEPSLDWTEPTMVTAIRALEAGLADGSLKVVEQDAGWFKLVSIVPAGSVEDDAGSWAAPV